MKKQIRWKKMAGSLKNSEIRQTETGSITFDSELQINPLEIIRLIKSNIKLLALSAFAIMAITAGIMFLLPNQYMSTASILPSGKADNFSALKELAGMSNPGGGADENSSLLYPQILNSRQVMDAVIANEYAFSHNDQNLSMNLKNYFGTEIPEYLYNKLDRITSISTNKKTGVITLAVETRYPGLSQMVLQKYIDELENFNLNKRQSSAKQNVDYLTRELAGQEQILKDNENRLEQFQLVNRDWDMTTNPEILKNLSRMKRELTANTETYIFIRQQYEFARLEEQKNIPIVRMLDNPSMPLIKSGPRRIVSAVIAGAAAFFLFTLLLIFYDAYRNRMQNTDKTKTRNIVNRLPRTASLTKK